MLELELSEAKAFINNFNPRAEKHGEERVPAGDVSFTVTTDSDPLAHFAPDLKAFLFNANGPRDLADGEPLRFPRAAPIHWDDEMTGATLRIYCGIGKPLEFADATLNKFVIEGREGGAVLLHFRAQLHPDERQSGRLAGLIQQEVTIDLVPAELATMREAA